MAESAVSQNELATNFSIEAKSLQPNMPIKRKQLDDELYAEFSPSECTLLEKFGFSELDMNDRELHLRILVKNNVFTYDVGNITKCFMYN